MLSVNMRYQCFIYIFLVVHLFFRCCCHFIEYLFILCISSLSICLTFFCRVFRISRIWNGIFDLCTTYIQSYRHSFIAHTLQISRRRRCRRIWLIEWTFCFPLLVCSAVCIVVIWLLLFFSLLYVSSLFCFIKREQQKKKHRLFAAAFILRLIFSALIV